MTSPNLAVLLSLRRAAEEEAKHALVEARAARLRAEEAQARLDHAAEEARLALVHDTKRRAAAPAPVAPAEGLSRERYRQRLAAGHARARERAAHHRQASLTEALAAENAALVCLRHAKQERQTIEKLEARQEAERRKQTERRAENATDDWVHATKRRH